VRRNCPWMSGPRTWRTPSAHRGGMFRIGKTGRHTVTFDDLGANGRVEMIKRVSGEYSDLQEKVPPEKRRPIGCVARDVSCYSAAGRGVSCRLLFRGRLFQ
jgi:hypothetical protein